MKHHYTIMDRLQKIMADRLIRLASAGWNGGERLAVWFSSNPQWEATAAKLLKTDGSAASLQEHYQTSQGTMALVRTEGDITEGEMCHVVVPEVHPARITVADSVCPYRWEDFKGMSGVGSRVARSLYRKAISVRSRPGEWWVSFEPVPSDKWLAIEIYDGSTWVPFTSDFPKLSV